MVDEIVKYISEEIDTPISAEDELLSSGLVDSITIMKIIAHLEDQYSVKVAPQDMVIENFNTVNSIQEYLSEQLQN